MKIYVGRWDLLPDWAEGYNWLSESSEEQISNEVMSQEPLDPFGIAGVYTPRQFEETFNQDLNITLNTYNYWIKIF